MTTRTVFHIQDYERIGVSIGNLKTERYVGRRRKRKLARVCVFFLFVCLFFLKLYFLA